MSTLPAPGLDAQDESGPLTAEGLLRRRARQRPGAMALADPPNRAALGLGPPRSLSYGEADSVVDALASFLVELGLEPGDRIAMQLPNLAEAPLTLLAAWRAGLTVVMLPMLWRGHEIGRMCAELEPRALVGVASFAGDPYAEGLRDVAAAHLSVRFVLGFGRALPDGVASLDDALGAARIGSQPPVLSPDREAPSLITFTARAGAPLVPVPRREEEILAQGAMTVMALSLDSRDVILNPYPFSSCAGLALGLAPWLIGGGALAQHHPFDHTTFVEQLLATGATVTAVPGPILAALSNEGVFQRPQSRLRRIGCVRMPAEPVAVTPLAEITGALAFDLYPLGDLASLVLRSETHGEPPSLPLGKIDHGEDGDAAVFVETKLSGTGTGEIGLRGPVVPRGEPGNPLSPDIDGFVGTGIFGIAEGEPIRIQAKRDPELLQHGSFTLAASELDALYQSFPGFLDAACFVLSDPIIGDRVFAAVVPRPGEPLSLEALNGFLQQRGVSPYKFPDRLLVVREIPRGASGQVLREAILQQV